MPAACRPAWRPRRSVAVAAGTCGEQRPGEVAGLEEPVGLGGLPPRLGLHPTSVRLLGPAERPHDSGDPQSDSHGPDQVARPCAGVLPHQGVLLVP